jgi:AraC-like DNA-binding protein
MEALKQAIRTYADQHANEDGLAATPIPGVRMMRAYGPTGPMRSIYKPLICLVLQGAKTLAVGNEVHEFTAGQSLILSVDRPVVGRITRASQREPYLALAVELDMGVVREINAQVDVSEHAPASAGSALFIEDTDAAALDCAKRLVRLLDRPDAIPVLRPSIVNEMHYWLLAGRHGSAIRQMALVNSAAERIARAVAIIRAEYNRPLLIERLASAAGMSPSSFHRHFKAVTSLSPVQFQKQLRLIEARRLMLSGGFGASRSAFEVGYESVSQFTREYARMFGAPPRRDIAEVSKPLAQVRKSRTDALALG